MTRKTSGCNRSPLAANETCKRPTQQVDGLKLPNMSYSGPSVAEIHDWLPQGNPSSCPGGADAGTLQRDVYEPQLAPPVSASSCAPPAMIATNCNHGSHSGDTGFGTGFGTSFGAGFSAGFGRALMTRPGFRTGFMTKPGIPRPLPRPIADMKGPEAAGNVDTPCTAKINVAHTLQTRVF